MPTNGTAITRRLCGVRGSTSATSAVLRMPYETRSIFASTCGSNERVQSAARLSSLRDSGKRPRSTGSRSASSAAVPSAVR